VPSQLSRLPVSDAELDDLRRRVRATRWAPDWPVEPWDHGVDASVLRRLAARWADGFDWRAVERGILALPSRVVDVDGTPVHALVVDGEADDALPLLLTNGWPSTSLELVPLARRLARPSEHGGDASDSFTVVVPSLPGFPFSPQRPQPDSRTHELWHRLMTALGHTRYGAHGGDLGAGITSRLGQSHPESVVGIHLLAVASPIEYDDAMLTDAERSHLARQAEWFEREGSYEHQQQQRPLTLAPALSDSPVGLLAWVLEKHRDWSDGGGDVSRVFSDEYLLTVASLYWFENAISTSFRPMRSSRAGSPSACAGSRCRPPSPCSLTTSRGRRASGPSGCTGSTGTPACPAAGTSRRTRSRRCSATTSRRSSVVSALTRVDGCPSSAPPSWPPHPPDC